MSLFRGEPATAQSKCWDSIPWEFRKLNQEAFRAAFDYRVLFHNASLDQFVVDFLFGTRLRRLSASRASGIGEFLGSIRRTSPLFSKRSTGPQMSDRESYVTYRQTPLQANTLQANTLYPHDEHEGAVPLCVVEVLERRNPL